MSEEEHEDDDPAEADAELGRDAQADEDGPLEANAEVVAEDADADPAPGGGLFSVVELSADQLRAFAGRVLAALDLTQGDAAHQHLAEQAVWLTVMNQDEGLRVALEDLLAGHAWAPLFPAADDDSLPTVRAPSLDRLALGLALQRRAGQKGPGAAQRALAAVSALALACADPDAGARLRRGFGRLNLLPITDQIPVALRVRMLALEYRHMPPSDAPPPPAFVARVEDLLEQLDAQRLLPYSLDDLPGRKPTDPAAAMLEVLLPGRARSLRAVARVLLSASVPFASLSELHEACADEAPDRWGLRDADLELRELERDYADLRALFADTPFALSGEGTFGRS